MQEAQEKESSRGSRLAMPCNGVPPANSIVTTPRSILCGGLLLLNACIPAPLPSAERNITETKTSQSKNALRRTSVSKISILLAGSSSTGGTLLGSQYLFGIIPLTAIRGEQTRIVGEALREELADQGARVILTAPDSLARLDDNFDATVQFLVHDLSVNAYDLFFVRRLSVSGDLELRIIFKTGRGNATTAGSEQITFSEVKTARFGFLPALSMMLHNAIRERSRPLLSKTLVDSLKKKSPVAATG